MATVLTTTGYVLLAYFRDGSAAFGAHIPRQGLIARLNEARQRRSPVHPDTLLKDVSTAIAAALEGIPPDHVKVNLLGGWECMDCQPLPLKKAVLPVSRAANRSS